MTKQKADAEIRIGIRHRSMKFDVADINCPLYNETTSRSYRYTLWWRINLLKYLCAIFSVERIIHDRH
jgi:hypothetical protein